MRWVRWMLGLAGCLAALYGLTLYLRGQVGPPNRGPAGVVAEIPGGYRVERLGEAEPQAAWAALHTLLAGAEGLRQAGVVYSAQGIETTLLADRDAMLLDERILASSGTLRRVFWPGDPLERLARAAGAGSLRVPGLPDPQYRNLYH